MILFHGYGCFACVHVCAPRVRVMPKEAPEEVVTSLGTGVTKVQLWVFILGIGREDWGFLFWDAWVQSILDFVEFEVFERSCWAALWMGPKWTWNSYLFPRIPHIHNLKVILCGYFSLGSFGAAACHMRSDRNFPHIDSEQFSKCGQFWNISYVWTRDAQFSFNFPFSFCWK